MPNVTIIQRVLPHYRIPFFIGLAEQLQRSGINLRLVYGQEQAGTVPKTVALNTYWSLRIENHYLAWSGVELVWQPCLKKMSGSDLVIVEQANRLLINYFLLAGRVFQKRKLAYWGHGKNLQSGNDHRFREATKRALIRNVDWWFAYTRLSANTVAASGFPDERITIVQNAVDTRDITQGIQALTAGKLREVRSELGIHTDNVCLYCGGMYSDKKLDFLVEACKGIKSRVPDFHMIFIGDGPEKGKIQHAAKEHSWIHYVGPKYGADRLAYFKISQAMLMPGLVGLAIVDCFAAGVPIITTDVPIHSPEIAYLDNKVNGIMTSFSMDSYIDAVSTYLQSPVMQTNLKAGCFRSAAIYTLDNMVINFANGIKSCLAR